MDTAEMNIQAQETAQRMKRQFPEMTDEQIIKVTRFIVLSAHAIKASEAFLAEQFGLDTGLSGKGYEMIFDECAKETLMQSPSPNLNFIVDLKLKVTPNIARPA